MKKQMCWAKDKENILYKSYEMEFVAEIKVRSRDD